MSATLRGVEALPVWVEVSVTSGLPGISIVGMPDVAVQESRERVRSAIRAAGFSMPHDKIVVNLAPGDVRKTGSGFDLPIAIGILVATGQIDPALARDKLIVGELSLEGTVSGVAGTLAFGVCAHAQGVSLLCAANSDYVPMDDIVQLGISDLAHFHRASAKDADGEDLVYTRLFEQSAHGKGKAIDLQGDYADIYGHEVAKRALQIAAAGGHGVLMMGPPGSGKSMLASRFGSILPPLDKEEALQAAIVHSVVGEPVDSILAGKRPFRSPHHSASLAGLVGGGSPLRPGEVTLAHKGILFLDELAEFKPGVLQGIRQPMENGNVVITRADGNITLPSEFMLIAASNPCPCGYCGDEARRCSCTVPQITSYQSRIGGPLLDRIDLHMDIRRVPPEEVVSGKKGTSSEKLRSKVMAAREFASWRRSHAGTGREMLSNPASIIQACALSHEDERFLNQMASAHSMSGRSIMRTLNVSRTIADMGESPAVERQHIAEALGFRLREGIGG